MNNNLYLFVYVYWKFNGRQKSCIHYVLNWSSNLEVDVLNIIYSEKKEMDRNLGQLMYSFNVEKYLCIM